MVSLISFRYGDKTAALNKCMVIFCLLFIFRKALSIYQHCVSQWDCIVRLSGLSHRALDSKNILEGFRFLCLHIAAAMNNSDPISLCYNDLCCVIDWGYSVLMHQLRGLCIYFQIKRNIYRICQHICLVCFFLFI